MSYFPKGHRAGDEVDDFDEYDPTPYGGGYDIHLTYGRPLPPSDETCYTISSSSSQQSHDYNRPQYSSHAQPSAYAGDALDNEYKSYTRPGRAPPASSYGYDQPQPNYGFQPGMNRPGAGGGDAHFDRRRPEYENPGSGYGSGGGGAHFDRRRPEYETPVSGYGTKPDHENPGSGYGRKSEYETPESGYGYGRKSEQEHFGSGYGSGGYGGKSEHGNPGYGAGGHGRQGVYENPGSGYGSEYGRKQEEHVSGGYDGGRAELVAPSYGRGSEGHGYGRSEVAEHEKPKHSYGRRNSDDDDDDHNRKSYGRKKHGDDDSDDDDDDDKKKKKHHNKHQQHRKHYDD